MKSLGWASLIGKTYVGTDELRKRLTTILRGFTGKSGEIIISQHGKPQAVLMDIDTYLSLTDGTQNGENREKDSSQTINIFSSKSKL